MFDNYSDNGSFLLTIVKLKLSLKYFQYLWRALFGDRHGYHSYTIKYVCNLGNSNREILSYKVCFMVEHLKAELTCILLFFQKISGSFRDPDLCFTFLSPGNEFITFYPTWTQYWKVGCSRNNDCNRGTGIL
jgi:hypothetical protein